MGLAPYEIASMMGDKDGGKLAMDHYILARPWAVAVVNPAS
jgi:hypothetical protein